MSALERVLTSVPEPLRWKLDEPIDFENDDGRGRVVPRHIGRIATIMTGWESTIADELGLTDAEKHDILEQNVRNPQLQRREALSKWKARLGRRASYKALVEVFVRAGHEDYAEVVCGLLMEGSSTATGVAVGATGHNRMGGGSLTQTATDTLVPTATAAGGSHCFSPTMGPTQLCQWLLKECGCDYQEDIDKVKAGGINGELFLELPEDKTLLQDLKVSPGFQRLLVKRAQQVKVQLSLTSSSTSSLGEASLVTGSYYTMSETSLPVGPYSTMSEASLPIGPCYASTTISSVQTGEYATMNEPSLPECSSSLHFPVCTTVDSDEEEDKQTGGDLADDDVIEMPPDDVQAACAHRNVIWRGRKGLRVKFLNDIPPDWMLDGSKLNKANIMSWANEWSPPGESVIPKFVRVEDPSAESDIRVLFSKRKTLCKIGNKAKRVESDQPTMWLNLHSGGIDDSFKKHLVVHEFGHALGLGHEHQRSDFWKILKPYLNEKEMKQELSVRFGVDGDQFERDWGRKTSTKVKKTAYDSGSVMHYWFKKSWLNPPYNNRNKILEDSKPGGCLSKEVAQVLLGVHDRDAENSSPPESPSNQDILLLKELYGSENTCTIMGPPPVGGSVCGKTNTQDPKKVTMFLLSNLKGKSGERINIINKVSPRWSEFAVQLDFDNDGTAMQMIRERCYPDPEACCKEMMREWLTGKGSRQPVTWELLVEILNDCELKVLAKQVEEAMCV